MKPYSLKPDAMSNQIMGRVHVATPDDRALREWAASLKNPDTIPARNLYYAAGRAMAQHHANQQEYRAVMRDSAARVVPINGRLTLGEM